MAIILELNRVGENDLTTYGVLSKVTWGGRILPICNIIENNWENNKANVSCIPSGIYTLERGKTSRTVLEDRETFSFVGVRHRTQIKFHIGNTHFDTEGCLLPVSSFGWIDVKGVSVLGGLSSRAAFTKFMEALEGLEEATLIILPPRK